MINIRCPYNIHRIKCRENFMNHQEKIIQNKKSFFNGCKYRNTH